MGDTCQHNSFYFLPLVAIYDSDKVYLNTISRKDMGYIILKYIILTSYYT